jgi:hypothetical protein
LAIDAGDDGVNPSIYMAYSRKSEESGQVLRIDLKNLAIRELHDSLSFGKWMR